MLDKKKVLLGMSGGVDSSVSALLLKEKGYEVIGITMQLWRDDNKTVEDAKKVCDKLGIEHHVVNYKEEFKKYVIDDFINKYLDAKTPNPCIECNKYIKFGHFYKYARTLGFDTIAMGHYAKRIDENGEAHLYKAFDLNKDQSYFLGQISSEQLSHALFPLSSITKVEVRKLAEELDLSVAKKKDSTGVCFIGERNFKQFLSNYLPAQKGPIVDIVSGKQIATHDGVLYYTVGQHRGLNLGGIKGYSCEPFFVVGKDVKSNILYVAQEKGNEFRFSSRCLIDNLNWIGSDLPLDKVLCNCKFRYRGKDMPVQFSLRPDKKSAWLTYDNYEYITKGQVACLYLGSRLLASGIVVKTFDKNYQEIRY